MKIGSRVVLEIIASTGWRLLLKSVFMALRFVFVQLQKIVWYFDGTSKKIEEATLSENYERCVHVLDVIFCHSFDWLTPSTLEDFILVHNRFESPSFILENDHVTLFTVTEQYAVFGEAKEKDMHLWKTEYGAFLKLAQLSYCNRLLLVPLGAFHRLAESAGDLDGKELVFLHSTGRCGSTLAVQMLNATGRVIAISEPEACNVVWSWRWKRRMIGQSIDDVTRDVIRMVCRPYKSIRPLIYLVKFPSFLARGMSVYEDLYPRSKHLFMYRDLLPAAKSLSRLALGLPSGKVSSLIRRLFPSLFKRIAKSSGLLAERFIPDDGFEYAPIFGLCMCVESITSYRESRQSGMDVQAIRYEDLIAHPMYSCERILEFCGLPVALKELALNGMTEDSQRNSPIARRLIHRHQLSKPDVEFVEKANDILHKHGLPPIGEELSLEGTITAKPEATPNQI